MNPLNYDPPKHCLDARAKVLEALDGLTYLERLGVIMEATAFSLNSAGFRHTSVEIAVHADCLMHALPARLITIETEQERDEYLASGGTPS